MRLSKPIAITRVSQALAKGGCPLCRFLKNTQSTLLQGELRAHDIHGICNFHAWALAAAVNVENAAKVFRHLLKSGFDGSEECSFCQSLREAESVRIKELVADLERHLVLDWNQEHGSLCRPHAKKVSQIAPLRLHKTIIEIDQRVSAKLTSELEELMVRSSRGEKAGAGVLGRIAEFLVTQRGVRGG